MISYVPDYIAVTFMKQKLQHQETQIKTLIRIHIMSVTGQTSTKNK